jgi:hypothetical protein
MWLHEAPSVERIVVAAGAFKLRLKFLNLHFGSDALSQAGRL